MTTLCQFQHQRVAQALSDYLSKVSIKNHIEHDNFNYSIILADSTQEQKALQVLTAFVENPNDNKYRSASWETGSTDQPTSQTAYANSNLMSNFISHAGALTHSIFFICVIIFIGIYLQIFNPMQSVFAFYQSQPFDLSQAWRFFTPALLHFSVLHITFNLLWWWQLGGIIEKQQGKQRLALILIFSAVASNLAQYFLVSPYFGGLSGVVYALVGYTWLYGRLNKQSLVNLSDSMFIFLLVWLVLGFVDILPVNVANYAHLVGLIAGLIIALISSLLKLKDRSSS